MSDDLQSDAPNAPEQSSAPAATVAPTHPLKFVPLLYFLQALPVTLVQEMSATVYKSIGIENSQIVLWSSLVALPWSFKLLWGPIVELNGTKRRWILGMQLLIGILIFLFALSLNVPNPFGVGMAILFLIAIFSATCDIATDGFYLLSVPRPDQPKYVGWQSTFYRVGRLFVSAAIVWVAGIFISGRFTGKFAEPTAWMFASIILAAIYLVGQFVGTMLVPKPTEDSPRDLSESERKANWLRLVAVLGLGVSVYFFVGSVFRLIGHWLSGVAAPFESFRIDPHPYVLFFYSWANEVSAETAEFLNIFISLFAGAIFLVLTRRTMRDTEMGRALGTFFGQKAIAHILAFMLFYRFGEAMLGRIVPIFLQDKNDGGMDPTTGLGLSVEQVALVNGTFGVVGIVVGGIIGGYFVARTGLRKSFWYLAAAMNVPNILYIFAALLKFNAPLMSGVMFFDQFGYGFGFAGYLVALQAIAQRNPQYRTAHYAIGTGLGASFIALAGILSSVLISRLDFAPIFVIVLFFTIPCLATLFLLPREVLEDTSQEVTAADVEA
ncbi:MAG: hypothetical protein KF812_11670 [Fimbriimonadaceae bacterium]|nr:hypothetical protein [Fimbriimonadaceae bacterium]